MPSVDALSGTLLLDATLSKLTLDALFGTLSLNVLFGMLSFGADRLVLDERRATFSFVIKPVLGASSTDLSGASLHPLFRRRSCHSACPQQVSGGVLLRRRTAARHDLVQCCIVLLVGLAPSAPSTTFLLDVASAGFGQHASCSTCSPARSRTRCFSRSSHSGSWIITKSSNCVYGVLDACYGVRNLG